MIAADQSRDIARSPFISEATVKTQVNRIFAKTGSVTAYDNPQATAKRLQRFFA